MEYHNRAVDVLIPYARNARTHSEAQVTKLAASIREFGFINPIIIDKDLNVIAGHGRLLAAKKLGLQDVPTLLVDHLSEAQKKAYVLADNRLALDAGWDEDMLALELQELKAASFDVPVIGFDDYEVANLLKLSDAYETASDDLPSQAPEYNTDIATVGVAIGAYKFTVSREVYDNFVFALQTEAGFTNAETIAGIKARLGLHE